MRPSRESYRQNGYAYFATTQTADRKPFFRHDRWGRLLTETIHHYAESKFELHAFVIMPDHVHLLITPEETLEKCMQLIKGGFSFRAKKELEWQGEIWQAGFTDHRIRDEEDWNHHIEYIQQNPLSARLVEDAILYPYLSFPHPNFPQGLKPLSEAAVDVRAKARTLQPRPNQREI